jgi:hypothetical protein
MHRNRTVAAAIAAACLLGGCKSAEKGGEASVPEREIDRSVMHEWPPVSLDSSGREHVILVQGPNPGWRVDLDAVQSVPDGKIAYATIRRANPERMYPQVITDLRMGSTVATTDPVEVVVRLAEHDGSSAGAYQPAVKVE